jgi:hypothetical protein
MPQAGRGVWQTQTLGSRHYIIIKYSAVIIINYSAVRSHTD